MDTKITRFWMLIFAAFLLSGCGGKMQGLSDAELQDNVFQCNSTLEPSPGKAVSCGNFMRECARRRDEGRFVC